MTDQTPAPRQAMEPWAKAYILGLVLFGIGVLLRQTTDDTMWIVAGSGAGLVCLVLGTVWLISGAVKRRQGL